MASIFTKIIAREIPAHILAENHQFIAFLDIMPLAKGHTLIVPKKEVDRFFDLPDSELASINLFAKKIATAIEKTFPCDRIGISVIGLEVPHAHMHLVPLTSSNDLNFTNPKLKLTGTELADIAQQIKANL
jgi:histidine triad (HIT) family protein